MMHRTSTLALTAPLLALAASCNPPSPRTATGAPPSASPRPYSYDPPDAGSLDLGPDRDAGPRSDCLPSVSNDGNAESAILTNDRLSVCLRFVTPTPQAPDGRVCYDLDLATGIYTRVPAHEAATQKALQAVARHEAAAAALQIASSTGEVTVCALPSGSSPCKTVRPLAWRSVRPAAGEACIPERVRDTFPADASPDGSTLFVVRHESCTQGMAVYGETYDLRTMKRLARAPLRVDGMITYAAWIGRRVLLRDCNVDANACSVSLVDPAAPPPATATAASWNDEAIAQINPGALDPFFLRAKEDLWAVVDRTGGQIALVNAATGAVTRTVKLPQAAELRSPLIVGARPPQQLFMFHGGTARVMLFDLAQGRATSSFIPPICGYDRGIP